MNGKNTANNGAEGGAMSKGIFKYVSLALCEPLLPMALAHSHTHTLTASTHSRNYIILSSKIKRGHSKRQSHKATQRQSTTQTKGIHFTRLAKTKRNNIVHKKTTQHALRVKHKRFYATACVAVCVYVCVGVGV